MTHVLAVPWSAIFVLLLLGLLLSWFVWWRRSRRQDREIEVIAGTPAEHRAEVTEAMASYEAAAGRSDPRGWTFRLWGRRGKSPP